MALAITVSQTQYVISVQSQVKDKNMVTGVSTMTNMLHQIKQIGKNFFGVCVC